MPGVLMRITAINAHVNATGKCPSEEELTFTVNVHPHFVISD
jgi:hypothetical protein